MAAYAAIAVLTILVALALLRFTRIPVVVTLVAATVVSGALIVWARLDLGYWDPFAPIAFVSMWFFAAIVSLLLIGLGRWLKWPFFLSNRPSRGQGAL